eukprot:3227867-Rhodomonas_salina.3
MDENAGVVKGGADWMQWVRVQLQVLQPDIMGINKYVFFEDVTDLRIPQMADFIPTKLTIKDMLDDMREQVSDSQSLFEWYLFSMRGTKNVHRNVAKFISKSKQVLQSNASITVTD